MSRYLVYLLFVFLGTYSVLGQDHRGVYVFERNNKKGLVNNKFKIIVEPIYEELGGYGISYYAKNFTKGQNDVWSLGVNYCYGEFIIFKLKGKFGVMNFKGDWVITPKYSGLRYTAESGVFRFEENNKFGLINALGEEILPAKFDYLSPEDKKSIIVKEKENYYLVDYKGKSISPMFPHRIVNYDINSDIFMFEVNDKYGYKKKDGTLLFEAIFDVGFSFFNGFAKIIKEENGSFGFVNQLGKIVMEPTYNMIFNDEGYNGYYILDDKRKYGLLDEYLNIVLEPKYDKIGLFSQGYAFVKKDNKFGFIDINGKLVVSIMYDRVSNFSDGLAPVFLNKKWGFINFKNEVVIDFKFVGWEIKPLSDGLSVYRKEFNSWGYLNRHGEIQIEPIYDEKVTNFINGVAIVYLKGNKYLINKYSKKFLLNSKMDKSKIIDEVSDDR